MSDATPAPGGAENEDAGTAEARLKAAETERTRRKRRLLELDKTSPRDTRSYAIAAAAGDRLTAIFDGRGVSGDGGDPGIVGEFLVSLDRLLEALGGGEVVLRLLDFTSSVRVELEPVVPADVAAELTERVKALPDSEHGEAATLAEGADEDLGDRTPPSDYLEPKADDLDQTLERDEELLRLIPTSVVAANVAARLLSVPSHQALVEARRYGADVPDAYLRLARTVVKGEGAVTLAPPGGKTTSLTADKSERVIAASKERPELERRTLRIVGTLTRTDSEDATFRVLLDRDLIPPEIDARKRYVEGKYTPSAEKSVQEESLWNQRVIATIHAFPVKDPTRSKPAYERFVFRRIQRAS